MQTGEMIKELSAEQLTHFYRQMVLIRLFEEKTSEMYHKGHISGYCHLYIGEEAIAVGALNALRPDDYVIGAYRDHGHAIVKGCDPRRVMAELFGKATGVSKGKGGSMHMFSRDLRFFGGDGIVAGELPVALGLAFAVEYQKGDQVVLCFFGDGAVNEGAFHEAMNWAALWNLPIIFLCENNLWGMGTPVAKASCAIELTERATCYCMRLDRVDGMDVLTMYDVVSRAVKHSRDTRKPTFIEATTQRFAGHSVTDAQVYRSKEEISKAREHDPIDRLRRMLLDHGIKQSAELDEIDREAAGIVDDAVQFAESSPFPEPYELQTDMWEHTEQNGLE